jgi:hypothetical protein
MKWQEDGGNCVHNEEVHNLCCSPRIIRMMKHVECMERRGVRGHLKVYRLSIVQDVENG